jgi:hypothetical protein
MSSGSASVFWLEALGTCSGPLSAANLADCLRLSRFRGNCFTELLADVPLGVRQMLRFQNRGVPKHCREDSRQLLLDISMKLDLTSRTDRLTSSFAGSNCDAFFPEETRRSRIMQFLLGLSNISWQNFKQLWQRSMPMCFRENVMGHTVVCLEKDARRYQHLL